MNIEHTESVRILDSTLQFLAQVTSLVAWPKPVVSSSCPYQDWTGLQAPVEDGLVHVDIALPDYKLAFFLENAQHAPAGQGHHPDTNALNG